MTFSGVSLCLSYIQETNSPKLCNGIFPIGGNEQKFQYKDPFLWSVSDAWEMPKKSSQGILNLPSAAKPTTCKACGMNYYSYMEKDAAVHSKYHDTFVNGPRWDLAASDANKLCQSFTVTKSLKRLEGAIFSINRNRTKDVKRIEALLEIVNRELSSPPANSYWKDVSENVMAGQAFVAVLDRRIVGLCVTEPIIDIEKQTRWIVDRTQEVVPNQTNKRCKVGISRIWVAPKWRRQGIGHTLLETVLSDLIYGLTLKRVEVAFSQPSYAGGKLARQFNGVKHKSGEILVPIYLECT